MKIYSYTPLFIILITILPLCVSLVPSLVEGVVSNNPHFVFNFSDSQRRGVYKIVERSEYNKGDLVLFNLKTRDSLLANRPWLDGKTLLIKRIGGLAGDSYCVTENTFSLNEEDIGNVFKEDYLGEALPKALGCKTLAKDEFLPISLKSERSFDGRYLGSQKLDQIVGKVRLVFSL